MVNKVLSIDQCKELVAMGVDMSNASMVWCPVKDEYLYANYILEVNHIDKNAAYWKTEGGKKVIPTFTLQDILELLPFTIEEYVCLTSWVDMFGSYHYQYIPESPDISSLSVLQAAFGMLKWCKENKYI